MNTFALPISGGVLLGLSMLGGPGSYLACIISLALLLSSLNRSKSILLIHLLYGGCAGAVGGFWVPEALISLGASAVESKLGLLVAIGWSALPGFATLGAVSHATKNLSSNGKLAAYCVALFAVETASFSVPGAVPWIIVGYSAVDQLGLAQLASIGGVPLVSAASVLIADALLVVTGGPGKRSKRLSASILAGAGSIAILGPSFAELVSPPKYTTSPSVGFLAVQPAIPRSERLRPSLQSLNVDRLVRYSRHAIENQEKHIVGTQLVWPENSIIDTIDAIPQAQRLAATAATSLQIPILLGATSRSDRNDRTNLRNSLFSLSSKGETLSSIDKYRAVPVIESSNPGKLESFARRTIGEAGRSSKIQTTDELHPMHATNKATVALCFEILFPWLIDDRRPEDSSAILNLADDSWVENPVASRQLTSIARYRAIEQRLPLARIAHGGLSAHYDAYGRLVEKLPINQYGSFRVDARPARSPTRFRRMMFLTLPVGAGMSVWWIYPLVARRLLTRIAR